MFEKQLNESAARNLSRHLTPLHSGVGPVPAVPDHCRRRPNLDRGPGRLLHAGRQGDQDLRLHLDRRAKRIGDKAVLFRLGQDFLSLFQIQIVFGCFSPRQ